MTPPQLKVGVLGATGTVGQRFIVLLSEHPYFVIHSLGASSRSAGKKYSDVTRWKQPSPVPEAAKDVIVNDCSPEHFKDCAVVFSGLDSDVAGPIEAALREANVKVFSNAKNYRRDPLCPLVVPLVNPDHVDAVNAQQKELGLSNGYIVTNANCSTTGVVVPLKALEDAFGPLEAVSVTTLQAISGAGYPGVPSLDILDNVVPYISGEEDKLEWETGKILGDYAEGKLVHRSSSKPIKVSATCIRVPVIDGHTESVSVKFAGPAPSVDDVKKALAQYVSPVQTAQCPSAPKTCIYVHEQEDRPQPKLDRYFQNGAGVNVGRIRECPVFDIKFVVLSNNVSIGAATSSLMNAEYAVSKGLIQ